jgi:hypothetical protein
LEVFLALVNVVAPARFAPGGNEFNDDRRQVFTGIGVVIESRINRPIDAANANGR